MKSFTAPLKEIEVIDIAQKHFRHKKTNIMMSGVMDSQISHLVFSLFGNELKVIITPNERKAKEIVDDLKFFEGDKVLFYPSKDLIFYSADVHSNDITRERMRVIEKLLKGETITLVMSIEALVDPLIPLEYIRQSKIEVGNGDEVDLRELMLKLSNMGYERVDLVESQGQFAVRGGLVDIYPINHQEMIRMELWGDEIDSIRYVNKETQRSVQMIESVSILPAREIVVSKERIQQALINIQKDYEKLYAKLKKADQLDVARELTRTKEILVDKVSNFGNFNGIESNVLYYYDKTVSVLDYLVNPKIILVEPLQVKERISGMEHEYNDSMQARLEKGYLLPEASRMEHSIQTVTRRDWKVPVINVKFSFDDKKSLAL
jgi:transcription-repair coupling factor (superfamily II helicase)